MGIESSKTCYNVVKIITEHTSFLVARNCWFDMNFSEKDMIVPMNSLCININYSLESLRKKIKNIYYKLHKRHMFLTPYSLVYVILCTRQV